MRNHHLFKIATENIRAAQAKYKFQFDKRSQEPKFQPADRVWLYCTKVAVGKAPKLHKKWACPYYITLLGPNHTYKVRNCATNKEVKSLINGVRLKIATENIRAAQAKYKFQFDKRSQEPKFQPADRVWLYCTKVAVGKAPKLHKKWACPYYITLLGPNHTYKVRNCATNKEVKSLINGVRLKPYYDPEDRPTNPPVGLENMEEELNAEEIADQVPNQVEHEVQEQKVRNEAQEGANTGRYNVENQAQGRANTGKTDVQPKKAQRKQNSGENSKTMKWSENVKKNGTQITSQLQNRVIHDQKANEKNDSRINAETQEKSKTYKGKGKKPQKKKGELQQKQPSQPQTGPREVRQSGPQPTITPEPLPGGSHETDQSVSNREKLEGQVRKEGVSHKIFSVENIDKLLSSQRSNGILYYRVKWKQPGSGSTWEYASSIPQMLIREFHASLKRVTKKTRERIRE